MWCSSRASHTTARCRLCPRSLSLLVCQSLPTTLHLRDKSLTRHHSTPLTLPLSLILHLCPRVIPSNQSAGPGPPSAICLRVRCVVAQIALVRCVVAQICTCVPIHWPCAAPAHRFLSQIFSSGTGKVFFSFPRRLGWAARLALVRRSVGLGATER